MYEATEPLFSINPQKSRIFCMLGIFYVTVYFFVACLLSAVCFICVLFNAAAEPQIPSGFIYIQYTHTETLYY